MSMENNEQIRADVVAAMESKEDLRERVRAMVMRALVARSGDPAQVRAVLREVFAGVGSGMSQRGSQAGDAARDAVQGLDEALGRSIYALQMALEEGWADGLQFAEADLKHTVDEIKGLEDDLLGTLKETADKGQGVAREVFSNLYDHLKRNGTDTGSRVKNVLEMLGKRLGAATDGAQSELRDQARESGQRLRAVASGILRGLADSLDSRK